MRERAALAALLALGLLPRLALVTAFPTLPVSDFQSILGLAVAMRDTSWTVPDGRWEFFSPGLPVLLSILLRIFPGSPEAMARLSTAVACGLVPLLPFALWRGVLPLWVRTLAGGLLALWPGQVLFSGVIAQDNWVLVPAVVLGALAARSLLARDGGYPVPAGLLYGLGVAIRQEMLVALFPLLLAAGGLGDAAGRRPRRLALLATATLLPLLALATHRSLATGRFALNSRHGGLSMLGSFVPGASEDNWADPVPFIAAVEPGLLADRRKMEEAGFRLALAEALRRPRFHVLRILASTAHLALHGEGDNLYWSLTSPDVQPTGRRERARGLAMGATKPLAIELGILQGLFLAALLSGVVRRNWAILAIAGAVLLKIALHAVVVAQGRYLLAATALEILAIALGAWEASRSRSRWVPAALAIGTVGALALAWASPRLDGAVQKRDTDFQRFYRFSIGGPAGSLDCGIARGRLVRLIGGVATLEPFHRDPAPGEIAAADCELVSSTATSWTLRLHDAYAPGGFPGRMLQRVLVDGREALSHDLSEPPGEGWLEIPLGSPAPGVRKPVRIEILAVQPDPGASWGRAASTRFQLVTSGGA
jgi:hypothetical protein